MNKTYCITACHTPIISVWNEPPHIFLKENKGLLNNAGWLKLLRKLMSKIHSKILTMLLNQNT